jgi:hypothetical protein
MLICLLFFLQIFARTVSGVFHSIKTALPSFDFELSPASSLQQLQHGIPFNTEEVRSSTLPGFLGFVGNRPHPRSNQTFNFKEKVSQVSFTKSKLKRNIIVANLI